MKRFARNVLPVILLAGVLPVHARSPDASVPLIERAKIFGNPSKAAANISPDGKWLSWRSRTASWSA